MIGQKKLQHKLNTTTIDEFPKSLILQGELGCGKHTFCKLIEEKFNDWDFVYVSNKINYEYVENICLTTVPTFYIIDGNKLSEKEQHALLKIFEEPPTNVNVILLINVLVSLLPTVQNRAVVWTFEQYSKEELQNFYGVNNNISLLHATTPGQIIELKNINEEEIVDLCNLIIDKIGVASIANVLSLSNKFKFNNSKKNNENGIIFSVFFKVLRVLLKNRIYSDISIKYIDAFKLINEYVNYLNFPVNDRMMFECFLLELKYILK